MLVKDGLGGGFFYAPGCAAFSATANYNYIDIQIVCSIPRIRPFSYRKGAPKFFPSPTLRRSRIYAPDYIFGCLCIPDLTNFDIR